jgi:hypothetical protein
MTSHAPPEPCGPQGCWPPPGWPAAAAVSPARLQAAASLADRFTAAYAVTLTRPAPGGWWDIEPAGAGNS